MSVDATLAAIPGAVRDDLPPLASGGIVRAYGPLIYLAMRLRSGDEPVEDVVAFRARTVDRLNKCRNMALQMGFHRAEVEDADYAVCSLLDETVLSRSGALRDSWIARTLQLERYGSERGGERFFELIGGGGQAGSPRAELLELYLLCLMAGFAGKYQADPARLRRLTEGVQQALRTKLGEMPRELTLSKRIKLAKKKVRRSNLPPVKLVAGACVLFFVMLWMLSMLMLQVRTKKTNELIDERIRVVQPSDQGGPGN